MESTQAQSGQTEKILALLGRKDFPTDGVEDYCVMLRRALASRGFELETARTNWEVIGWQKALSVLEKSLASQRRKWVLLQHTSLSWSRRGFPFGVLALAKTAKRRGTKLAVVFHESDSTRGRGLTASARAAVQRWIIRRLYSICDRAIFTVPLAQVVWLPKGDAKSRFIPIGSNLWPLPSNISGPSLNGHRTVGVFCVTESIHAEPEVREICDAVRQASRNLSHLRLLAFGRGALDAHVLLEKALKGSGVELEVLGVLPPDEAAKIVAQFDVLCYVRGQVSPQRGSILAAVACQVPVVGYGHPDTCAPLDEAGVVLVPPGDRQLFCAAIEKALMDEALRARLRQKNCQAQQKYFSWDSIAERYAGALQVA